MSWLGVYIQTLISRFRNNVYLESVASGTIASGGNLGLDSNNLIVKANEVSPIVADPYSSTIIKILPSQFIANDDNNRAWGVVEDDTSNTLGIRMMNTVLEAYAFQKLPFGYKATHVQVHASASTSSAVTVRSFNYQTGADNNVSETSGDFNTNIDITDIPVGATQDLVIKIIPASTSTIIYGATVTIAAV
tara:strand:- start:432 stop:1004 length:573 start_codon:yes stop_codon:yes gene_type:complete